MIAGQLPEVFDRWGWGGDYDSIAAFIIYRSSLKERHHLPSIPPMFQGGYPTSSFKGRIGTLMGWSIQLVVCEIIPSKCSTLGWNKLELTLDLYMQYVCISQFPERRGDDFKQVGKQSLDWIVSSRRGCK